MYSLANLCGNQAEGARMLHHVQGVVTRSETSLLPSVPHLWRNSVCRKGGALHL